ncbi:F-box and leucine-rich repeat protein 13 [Sarotherodon galilaeus]
MLSMTVEGTELPFLVDTGATYSTLRDTPDCATLSSSTVSVVGFSGIPMTLPLTDPALTQLGKQTLKHQYVVSPQVPVNLMGRDLLVKLGATIMCSADGLTVTLPGGKEFLCLGSPSKTQYLVRDSEQSTADIYWGRLVEEGILRTYQQWRPWIMSLAVYSEPRDPYHVTLFYDKEEDDTYREQFESDLEGETWKVKTHNIYIGPEGVAAAVKLTDEQLPWYNVGEDSAPHITLAVHVGHEARELGPMVKRALDNSWWQAPSVAACTAASLAVLNRLAECGFKVSKEKLQLVRPEVEEKVREDLKAEPIAGAEEWFTDGCCHRDEEGLKAGYAVVRRVGQEYQVIEAGRTEGQQSAQRAEVIALIRALRLAKNLKVNIYTDSAYAFGAAHVELAQWKRTGYRTATNAPICHKKEMEELEKALEDPDEVSIVKCKGHSQGDNPVARGNQTADEAAKKAAGYKGQRQMVQVTAEEEVSTNTLEEVRQAQKEAAPEEKGVWQAKGAWQEEGLWRSPDGRPVLTTKMAKQKSTGFTPYELLTGRQFPAPWTVVSAEQPQKRNRSHAEYFNELKALVSSFTKQVTCEKPREKGEVPDAKAVWLKVIKRKWKEPRWTGPYEVTARTATAVQLRGKGDTWFHWTQCAAADESLVDEDLAPPDTGGNESKRQNKSSPLCNGPIGSLPERPKQEEPLRRRSPRLQKGATTN